MEENTQERLKETGDCKPYNFSVVPYKIEPQLEFLDISDDGYLLLGSSNLVLSYWSGSFWYFKDADLAPNKEHSLTGHGCEYSMACGKFLDNRERVIIGDDSGTVTIHHITTFENDTVHIIPQMSSVHHESCVNSLTITSSKTQTITSGDDLAINVWDNESLVSEHRYALADSRLITCVSASPEENSSIFASSSLSGIALLWDPRQSKAAQCIKHTPDCGLTVLCWKDANEVISGSVSGEVAITDIRVKKDLHKEALLDCSVHNLAFNGERLLAVCGDSTSVKTWDTTSKSTIYTDERHTGLVRGLAWHPISKKLYSCGFDKKVLSHEIVTTDC